MSRFAILSVNDRPVVTATNPLIKKHELYHFEDAVALLTAAEAARNQVDITAKAVREEGYAAAHAEASDAFASTLTEQLRSFSASLEQFEEQRRTDIANAAFAAVQMIIGEIPDTDIIRGLVNKTLERLGDQDIIAVHLAPATAHNMGALAKDCQIIADPDLGPFDCHVLTAQSRIVASLSVQLDTLAGRWGVNRTEMAGDAASAPSADEDDQ